MLRIALVGRPNVGKSTLFNKLTISKKTIVHDFPGVTRDFTINKAQLGNVRFELLDTAGIFNNVSNLLDKEVLSTTLEALKTTDILLFLVDAQVGLNPHDIEVAKLIRKLNKPVILTINKCDGSNKFKKNLDEFDRLGFDNIIAVSAEHKIGFADLLEKLQEFQKHEEDEPISQDISKDKLIKLAIIGKPNTGKSTLINKILNKNRLVTGPEAGVTRDAIISEWQYKNYIFNIVDTAGLRKRKKITKDSIEQYAVSQTISTVNTANIIILLNDVNEPLQKQDLKIANLAINEGKPIIVSFNKTDLFKDIEKIQNKLNKYAHEVIHNIKEIPIYYLSALYDKSFTKLMDAVIKLYEQWNTKLLKRDLNDWLHYATEQHQPPLAKSGRRIKLKYIVQTSNRPPSFKIFANIPEELPQSYIKYLTNSLQKSFELSSIPVRIELTKSHNPYSKS